jgi:hypothetical protein
MTFKPVYDLESLTEAQRQEYYLNACEHYGIPPELNALAFIWMDSNDGKRNLVLYAKKAATDIIRGIRGITTTSLTKFDGEGYIGWIAEGKDSTGRAEIAVGTASTEGLRGQSMAMMAMLAQTRATRRMTLQFVGGLLDESELPATVTNIGRSGASLASLSTVPAPVQPSVAPNSDAGVDVTPKTFLTDPLGKSLPAQIFSLEPPFQVEPRPSVAQNPPEKEVSLHRISNPSLAPKPFSGGDITPKTVETIEQIMEPEAKKRPGRRRKSEIVLDCPASEDFGAPYLGPEKSTELSTVADKVAEHKVPILTEPPAHMNIPTQESAQEALTAVATTTIPCLPAAPVFLRDVPTIAINSAIDPIIEKAAVDLGFMPSEAEEKAWRARLFVYTNDVLPKGGMAKADGIIWKIRKYVQLMFPELPVKNGTVKLDNNRWALLMKSLDYSLSLVGPAGLVKMIEDTVK